MAQQAIRKMKRKQKAGNWLLKGLLVSVAVTVAAVVIFAVIIGLTNLPDSVIRIVNQVIKVGAVFAGVYAAVPKGSDNAIRKGVVIGLVYMGVGVLLYALLSGQQLTVFSWLLDILMGIAAGGLSGMIVGSMQGK
ncbi:MAG: TIGR04086 family membrane protein [Clostridia bacterium]|nr:TIGR04086 family membrane protein [Clostridia bacterium]